MGEFRGHKLKVEMMPLYFLKIKEVFKNNINNPIKMVVLQ